MKQKKCKNINSRKNPYKGMPFYQKTICAYELMGVSPDIYLKLIKAYHAELEAISHMCPLDIVSEITKQGLHKLKKGEDDGSEKKIQ